MAEESMKVNLPHDIVIEILSWLPETSLLRFESVCTNWLYLFTKDSNFSKLHAERRRKNPASGISSQLKALSIFQQVESLPEILAKVDCDYTKSVSWYQNSGPRSKPQVVVIAPDREITKYFQCIYFADMIPCLERHRRSTQVEILVGTPTYLCQLLQRKIFGFKYIDLIVLFEIDEMLSRGFRKQINFIFKFLPKGVKVKKISATMPLVPFELWKEEVILKEAIVKAELNHYSFQIYLPERAATEKLVALEAFGRQSKIKCRLNSEKRKKRSTISWNPHLKMHK